ncbi:protein IQ-DOMAIN 32 [Panicum miliaceum]|uniref:Protein IQ-DOMAIN 32 n=1 Tax=Panicum miliaceum TaxID=4540 RepID=A0A3L6PXI6_PANMI|nr:protein IQ-DOMAIN 32 [Panicum miliaceum]
MARSKNGCLKILVCAGSGSDPSAGSDADADDHPDEVPCCVPPKTELPCRGMRRLSLCVACRALSKVVSFSSWCACFGRSLPNAWGSGGRVCDILARSGFNSDPGAGIKRPIGRFLSDSPAPLSYFVGLNFDFEIVVQSWQVDNCSPFREHDAA